MKAVLLGILASLFFAVTFVLNRAMDLSGGSWIWSAVLRYFFIIPLLLIIVIMRFGELVFLHGTYPSIGSLIGIFMVITGMILHTFFGHKLSTENI